MERRKHRTDVPPMTEINWETIAWEKVGEATKTAHEGDFILLEVDAAQLISRVLPQTGALKIGRENIEIGTPVKIYCPHIISFSMKARRP